MSVTTAECKEAIVDEVEHNKAMLSNRFDPPESMEEALLVKNWKCINKRKVNGKIERTFDCKPYDDQLRAYTYDDGTTILEVEVEDE